MNIESNTSSGVLLVLDPKNNQVINKDIELATFMMQG